MNKKTMYLIIILMTVSIIGTGMIQLIWFKSSVDQDEKNFSDKVYIAMGLVKENLLEDAQRYNNASDPLSYKLLNQKVYDNILNSARSNWEKQRTRWELRSNQLLLNADNYFEDIDKDKLDKYIKHELSEQGIDLEYDYGVYSTKRKSFFILNGNYVVEVGDNVQASDGTTDRGLHNSDYSISLFTNADDISNNQTPGYLKIYFPEKDRWLWSSVWPSILMSLLFTGLILGCFAYVLYIIVRQKKVSEMKTDFINNMTHEFKTPIATISLATDSINNPGIISDENKVKRFTGIIKQENERMLGQVEKVLQMAIIDKKEFDINQETVNIHDVILEAIENAELKVQKRQGILEHQLEASNSNVIGDKTHLSNIINNLLDNAEKYSPKTPNIQIRTYDNEHSLYISVKDHGKGMTKEQIKHIFDKFYRVHTGNIHDVKGFGLGLSYVKAIVESHKGKIKVKSTVDEGSEFIVELPIKQNRNLTKP